MKRLACAITVLLLAAAAASAQTLRDDYLSPAEVEKVRETQEPNQRTALFLKFARERLALFEGAYFIPPDQEPVALDDLQAMLDDFIFALDDAAETVEVSLERGGVDLRKTRDRVAKTGQKFLARLQKVQQAEHPAREELRWDLEDAVEATQDLLALGKKIPDGLIPPRAPSATAGQPSGQPQPGRPTLKRKKDKKEDDR